MTPPPAENVFLEGFETPPRAGGWQQAATRGFYSKMNLFGVGKRADDDVRGVRSGGVLTGCPQGRP